MNSQYSYRIRFSQIATVVFRYALLISLSILFLIPFYLVIRNALMTQSEVAALDWIWWPSDPQWQNFDRVFNDPIFPMSAGLRNSIIISTIQVAGQLFFAALAGYGLARIPYRWSNHVFYIMILTLMIPTAAIFIPTFVIVARMGWVNTLQGIIIPGWFNVFATLIFRQFFLDFPREIEEAARVDGLGYLGIFLRVVMPNAKGVTIALGTIAFINSWNAFLWPLVVGQDQSTWTVQIVISSYLTAQTIDIPAIFTGAAIAIAPIALLFLFLQRYIVEGVKLTGTKM